MTKPEARITREARSSNDEFPNDECPIDDLVRLLVPELPEVETMRRGLLCLEGRRIASVNQPPCQCRPIALTPRMAEFRRRAVGQRIESIERRGKRVLLVLAGGDAIVFEPRMTGVVLVGRPPDRDYLRFELTVSGRGPKRLLFWDRRGLGSVKLLRPREIETQLGAHQLGPDAMAVTAAALREQFANSRRAIKVALLDQRSLAGIGNLYASEILHVAGVHPERPCARLAADEWRRVHAAMRRVLKRAIAMEGSTLSDGTYRTALNNAGSYQNCHRVYDRRGDTCPTCCIGTVERIVQGQRSTFFCPICQPGNGRSRSR